MKELWDELKPLLADKDEEIKDLVKDIDKNSVKLADGFVKIVKLLFNLSYSSYKLVVRYAWIDDLMQLMDEYNSRQHYKMDIEAKLNSIVSEHRKDMLMLIGWVREAAENNESLGVGFGEF